MKKLIRRLSERRDYFNRKLKLKLESLPSEAKVNIVLMMMAVYLIVTFIVFIGIIRGRSSNALDIHHIESAPLIDAPVKIPQPGGDETAFCYPQKINHLVNR